MEPEITTPQSDKQAPIETLPRKPIWQSKFLWAFMAFSFFAAFLIGGLVLGQKTASKTPSTISKTTPTPDPTAGWKTYSNQYLSFNYPSNWIVTNESTMPGLGDTIQSPDKTTIELIKQNQLTYSGECEQSSSIKPINGFYVWYMVSKPNPYPGGLCSDWKSNEVVKHILISKFSATVGPGFWFDYQDSGTYDPGVFQKILDSVKFN